MVSYVPVIDPTPRHISKTKKHIVFQMQKQGQQYNNFSMTIVLNKISQNFFDKY